jgi:hypothetical protein
MDCIINNLTGRAVKINSAAGRRALKYNTKNKLESSHDCIVNPKTGRAVKKNSLLGRKILKGLIPEVKPKATKKEPPAPITIPKKKYDFGDFKTPTKYPDSPPLTRTKSVPKNMGKTKKEPKPEPKAYTMYKKPIGPVKPTPKAYTMYKKPIGPVKMSSAIYQTKKDEYTYFKNNIAIYNRNLKEMSKKMLEKSLNVINEYLEIYYKDNKITTQNEKDIIMAKIFKNIDFSIYETYKYDADGMIIRDDYYIEMSDKINKFINELKDEIEDAKKGEKITELTLIENVRGSVKQNKTNKKIAKLEEFINDTENYLNKKSTRAFNVLMKKYDDKEYISSIIGAQMFGDFYPTSQKCLSHYSDYIENFDKNDVILEPTAGLGSIVLWLLKSKVKSHIITTDFDANLNEYLKESFDGVKQVSVIDQEKSNYLKLNNNFNMYHPSVIFLNPPFSNGNDKKYYLNFLFKALYDLKNSNHPHNEKQLFFICPKLTINEKDNNQISFDDIIISKNKKEEIIKMLKINTYDWEWDDLRPTVATRIKACNDFGGTKTEAVLYLMNIFN